MPQLRLNQTEMLCGGRRMNILSIQSYVAYGRVGNAAATFPLQRLGHEVWPVNTVNFSNHPGYGSFAGGVFHPSDVSDILAEIEKRGAFARCGALLSGYLGEPETGDVVLDALDRIRAANPRALYILDPVMGDIDQGHYVPEEFTDFFRNKALPRADIVIPNMYELEVLSGRRIEDIDGAATAAAMLLREGPEMVIVTGLRHERDISTLLVTGGQAWQATNERIAVADHGAGDLFAALFLGNYLNRGDARWALTRAVSSIYGILRETAARRADAPAVVAAQREIVNPSMRVAALPLWSV